MNVTVSLTIETETPKDDLLLGVLKTLNPIYHVIGAYTYTDDDTNHPDDPEVNLVIAEGANITGVYINNPRRAEEHARNIRGVLTELPVIADYRPPKAEREQ